MPTDPEASEAQVRAEARAERVRLVHGQGHALVLGAALAAAATMLFPWWRGEGAFPSLWLAALAAVSLVRLALIRAYHRRDPATVDAARWGRRFWLGALAAGCLWSAWATLRHDPAELEFQFLISTIFAGMVAVSATTAGVHLPAFLAFSMPIALPLALLHVASGRDELVLVGALLGLFLAVATAVALRVSGQQVELVRARRAERAAFEGREDALERLAGEKRIAEAAVVAKTRFLAAASHDLRQPLHALVLCVETLRRRALGHEEADIVADIASSTDALKGLLDSLLDLSRLDAETVPFEPRHVALDALLERLGARFAPAARDKGIELAVRAEPVAVLTDPILLERVLGNLLANAVRYTERGGVLLDGAAADGACLIRLIDTGVGIPEAAHEEVFGEYVRLGDGARCPERGLGLGLSIVRRLCALMEVPLEMESEPGLGTSFRLRVPAGDAARVVREPDAARPIAGDGALVLVIDDEPAVLEATTRLLGERGWSVLAAASAREALRAVALAGREPDVVLSDLGLGAASGVDAIVALREAIDPALPALIVTGDTCPERLAGLRACGLEALYKPVAPAALDAALARALSGGSAGRRARPLAA